ncbi:Imm26 family immunity protein [Tessaracoccus caeni]|uniref:Imm26 family immunity protein n=1 Tax=Tessaracoccus caeni TaxID=3031239 RepID=UPI0023DB4D63|nr:Imm26 family immunity protein [Tessaracoccus caeni]MDF1488277.1 Imm26 family immunity protein [Tessaracoccus caeni]
MGDWFAVPLWGDAGWAVGVVARGRGAVVVGYFFGPPRTEVPRLEDVAGYRPEDAVLSGAFGFLGFKGGSWRILGRLPDWDPVLWPMPRFFRDEPITGRVFESFYSEKSPRRFLGERRVSSEEAKGGASDGLMGAEYVEIKLAKLLGVESAGGASR